MQQINQSFYSANTPSTKYCQYTYYNYYVHLVINCFEALFLSRDTFGRFFFQDKAISCRYIINISKDFYYY